MSTDPGLATAVRELEAHAAERGWDQPSSLFALVDTQRLLSDEPDLAQALALDASSAALTPIEQEELAPGQLLEEVLERIVWPPAVAGAAAVVERVVLPPEADAEIPDDPEAAQEFARNHPARQDVRIVAAVTRTGSAYCALRLRAHDDDASVLTGDDLVPELLRLLQGTFDEMPDDGGDHR